MKKRLLTMLCVVVLAGLAQAGTVEATWNTWGGMNEELGEWQDNDTVWVMQADSVSADSYLADPIIEGYLFTVDGDGIDFSDEEMPVWYDNYNGRNGVIELNADDQLYFELDNYPGGDYKELLFTITYYDTGVYAELSPVDQSEGSIAVSNLWLGEDSYQDGWITETFQIIYEPNPLWEAIQVNFVDESGESSYPAYIDQVTIMTECVPEPATLAMLALGGVMTAIRRRK